MWQALLSEWASALRAQAAAEYRFTEFEQEHFNHLMRTADLLHPTSDEAASLRREANRFMDGIDDMWVHAVVCDDAAEGLELIANAIAIAIANGAAALDDLEMAIQVVRSRLYPAPRLLSRGPAPAPPVDVGPLSRWLLPRAPAPPVDAPAEPTREDDR